MIFKSKKSLEEEINRRIWEEEEKRRIRDEFDRVNKRINDLEEQMFSFRFKYDQEFRQNTKCDCLCNSEANAL